MTLKKTNTKEIVSIREKAKNQETNPPWEIETIRLAVDKTHSKEREIYVIQDAVLVAGSKQRIAVKAVESWLSIIERSGQKVHTLVYTGTWNGYGAVATAYAACKLGLKSQIYLNQVGTGFHKKATLETIKSSRQIKTLMALGATIHLCSCWTEARKQSYEKATKEDWTLKKGYFIIPTGFHDEAMIPQIGKQFLEASKTLPSVPKRIWLVAGSGTLAMSLRSAFPLCTLLLLITGGGKYKEQVLEWIKKEKNIEVVNDWVLSSSLKNILVPYNTVKGYDGNIYPYVVEYGKMGDYILNVGSD